MDIGMGRGNRKPVFYDYYVSKYDMEIFCKNIKLGEFVGKVCFLRNHLSLRQIIKVSAQPLTSRMYKNMGREIFFYQ